MNRRAFIQTLVGGVCAEAAVRSWPYRIFSFPRAPVGARVSYRFRYTVMPPPPKNLQFIYYDKNAMAILKRTVAESLERLSAPRSMAYAKLLGPRDFFVVGDLL